MNIKEPLVFSTLYGSKLYGTAGPNSDTDIRGVFLPFKKDLLLNKAPDHYNFKADTDTSYLSLHYFLRLLTQGETNALDMFFSYTNKEAQLSSSHLYEHLVANKDKLITKNVSKYLGYCKSQALKYSIKGDKIQSYEALNDVISKCKNPSGTTLESALETQCIIGFGAPKDLGEEEVYMKGTTRVGVRYKIDGTPLGQHAYILVCDNKEQYLMLSGHLFPLNANLNTTKDSIIKCLASYGKRAQNAAADNGADYKALSHALRVAYQAERLLQHGEILFPLPPPDINVIRDIKFKTTYWSYEKIVEVIEHEIQQIETYYLPESKLPDKPDWDWINNLILEIYEENKWNSNLD